MADTFDPYRDWLGLNVAAREYPLNHYQLLDLERRDADNATIQQAAEKMLARVRSQRPGDRAADWGRLLDEIETARDCLTIADRRAAYDAELVASNLGRVATPETSAPAASDSQSEPLNLDQGAWSPPQFDAVPAEPETPTEPDSQSPSSPSSLSDPPAMTQPPATQPADTPTPPASPAADSALQPTSDTTPKTISFPRGPYEQVDRPMASDNADPPTAQPVSAAADPMAPVAIPVASPVAAPVAKAATASAASSYNPVTSMPPEMPGAIQPREDTARAPLSRTALFGIVAALLLWAAGMAAYFSGAFDTGSTDDTDVTENGRDQEEQSADNSPPQKNTKPKPPKEKIPAPKPDPRPQPAPTPSPETPPQPEPTPMPQPVPTPVPTPEPPPNPLPPIPEPPPKPEPPAREQIAKFLSHLSSARAALTKRDFRASQQHLDDAGETAMPAELEAKRERLQALHDATNDFWLSLAEAVADLKGGEEFKLSESTIIRIIEVNDRQLIIRTSGQTLRYPVEKPPMGVARLLVASWLHKEPTRTKIAIGASWATIADADLDKAREDFRQAADAGVDTSALIQALDDDYRAP